MRWQALRAATSPVVTKSPALGMGRSPAMRAKVVRSTGRNRQLGRLLADHRTRACDRPAGRGAETHSTAAVFSTCWTDKVTLLVPCGSPGVE